MKPGMKVLKSGTLISLQARARRVEILTDRYTSISFFKKVVGHLVSTIACTLMTLISRMLAYVSRVIELT